MSGVSFWPNCPSYSTSVLSQILNNTANMLKRHTASMLSCVVKLHSLCYNVLCSYIIMLIWIFVNFIIIFLNDGMEELLNRKYLLYISFENAFKRYGLSKYPSYVTIFDSFIFQMRLTLLAITLVFSCWSFSEGKLTRWLFNRNCQ